MVHHNKKMEELESKNFELKKRKLESMQWKGKQDELDYRLKLVKEYSALSGSGSDDQIVLLFPEMKAVVEPMHGDKSTSS
jgi:hypothetical protein